MGVIYLEHPRHGQKACSTEQEAKHDREHGWTDFTPAEPPPPVADLPSFLGGPVGGSDLKADFPGREALVEAGYTTWASLVGKSSEELQTIKGIGKSTADKILGILEG